MEYIKINEGEERKLKFDYSWGKNSDGKFGEQVIFGVNGNQGWSISAKSPVVEHLKSMGDLKGKEIVVGKIKIDNANYFTINGEPIGKRKSEAKSDEINDLWRFASELDDRITKIENDLGVKDVQF